MGKKFFLITIDDLRRDRTSLELNRDTTPFLNEFADRSFYSDCHFSCAPASPGSFRNIFSGTFPKQFSDDDYLSDERPYFPDILSDSGIRTVGLTTNPYISTSYGFERGYSKFEDTVLESINEADNSGLGVLGFVKSIARRLPFTNFLRVLRDRLRGQGTPYLEADEVTERAKRMIETESDEDTFYWFHYMDPHSPFMPPEETYGEWNSFESNREAWRAIENDGEGVIDLYDECVLFMDRYLGELVNYIERNFDDEDYEILITSDHGELFPEDDKSFSGHPSILEEKLFEVPLFFRSSGEVAPDFSTHLDIAPTVLDFFGVDTPEAMKGFSFYSGEKREYGFAHSHPMHMHGMTDEQRKPRAGKMTGEGFATKADLRDSSSTDDDELKKHIEFVNYSSEAGEEEKGSELSEEEEEKVKENLRQLGYDE